MKHNLHGTHPLLDGRPAKCPSSRASPDLQLDQAENEQVQRVINVEQPLHHPVDGRVFPAAAVIQRQQRDGQHHAQLQQPVQLIQRKEIHHRVQRHIKQAPGDLLLGVAAVGADGQDAQSRNAAPVGGQGKDADEDNTRHLDTHGTSFVLTQPQHQQAAQQRPHHAGLVQQLPVVERDKGMRVQVVIGGQQVGKMRYHRQRQQPQGVFFAVMGMVKPLRNEKAHNGAGDPPDDMHDDRHRCRRVPGEQQPRHMVHRHGRYGNEL